MPSPSLRHYAVSLTELDGGFFHVLAHGETDETAILIPAQLTGRDENRVTLETRPLSEAL